MARILHAWELGAGYGHLVAEFALAAELSARGHQNVFVIKDVAAAERLSPDPDAAIYQAPISPRPPGSPRTASNYADLLQLCGYTDARGLAGLIKAWLRLFDHAGPDLVVLDHAPTAALAARHAGLPAIPAQNGFCIPPDQFPLPSIQPWKPIMRSELRAIDRQVLAVVNGALGLLAGRRLERLGELFDPNTAILRTLPEFDHYGPRQDAAYIGPITAIGGSRSQIWADADPPKAFAYFASLEGAAGALVRALAEAGVATLVHVRERDGLADIPATARAPVPAADPVDPIWASRQSDFVACHGGHGTVCGAVLAGAPVVLVPTDVEKALLGYRLSRQGLALNIDPRATVQEAGRAVRRMLQSPQYRERAKAVETRYLSLPIEKAALRLADACVHAMTGGATQASAQ